MKVSELGQFGLIDVVARMVEESRDDRSDSWRNLIAGVGDDCAVWKSEGSNQLAKVDCQVEGIHFNLDIIGWEDLGWKALAVNLSDIASMGGIPRYALVSLGLPLDTGVENVVSLYKGILNLAGKTGTAVVGGNMSGSPVVFVDISVLGITGNPEGRYLARSAARPGDRIAVTGWLGTPAAGLEMLTGKLNFPPHIMDCLKKAFVHPEPRLKEGRILLEQGVSTAIDISDGLLADLGHVCTASRVGAVIEIDRIPIREEVRAAFGGKALEMALSGGEDYQLLFTAPARVIEQVQKAADYPVTEIGEIIGPGDDQIVLLNREGKRYRPEGRGWDHFQKNRGSRKGN